LLWRRDGFLTPGERDRTVNYYYPAERNDAGPARPTPRRRIRYRRRGKHVVRLLNVYNDASFYGFELRVASTYDVSPNDLHELLAEGMEM
jgi:hypothetical protein